MKKELFVDSTKSQTPCLDLVAALLTLETLKIKTILNELFQIAHTYSVFFFFRTNFEAILTLL